MIANTQTIDQETLESARRACERLDPAGAKTWALEVYDLTDGTERVRLTVDLKTGKIRRPTISEA